MFSRVKTDERSATQQQPDRWQKAGFIITKKIVAVTSVIVAVAAFLNNDGTSLQVLQGFLPRGCKQ